MIKKTTNQQKPTVSKTEKTAPKAEAKQQKSDSVIAENSDILLTLKAKDVTASYQKNLQKMASKLKVDGFRIGKAPLAIAEQSIGQEKLINQVLQDLVPNAYAAALKEKNLRPLSQPRFQPMKIVKDQDWEIKAYFALEPSFELGDYKKIAKEAKKAAEKQLAEIKKEAQKNAAKTDKNVSKADNKDDKVAAETSKEDLNENQQKEMTLQEIFKALIKNTKLAIPHLLVEEQTQQDFEQLSQNLAQLNLKVEDYLKAKNTNVQELTQQLAAGAVSKLQIDFILNKVAKEAKLTVNEEEVKDKIKELKNPDLEKKMSQDQYYQNYLKSIILRQKTLDYLYQL